MPALATSASARLLAALPRLTPRDHRLLDLLADHTVLSTSQIAAITFGSMSAARTRLTTLHRLGMLSRHARGLASGGRSEYLYSLGPAGALLRPHASTGLDGRHERVPARHTDRVALIAASPHLGDALARSQFFADLTASARTSPDTRLTRWWSHRRTAEVFGRFGIRDASYGVWQRGARTTGFFLYLDPGRQPISKVLSPLAGHRWLAEVGPRHPVLIQTTTAARAKTLLDVIGRYRWAGVEVAVIVAGEHPAERVWRLASERSGPYALHELPSHPQDGAEDLTIPYPDR
ncbi:replication-relaxation family protein [Longispora albida]|uniref:replication-relaxation family protein n=1 Tax=Longispora albida TaxID=203523 RepID=UPI000364BFC3|nr:replication-relaxation family protein [Longispora albida]